MKQSIDEKPELIYIITIFDGDGEFQTEIFLCFPLTLWAATHSPLCQETEKHYIAINISMFFDVQV